MKSYIQPDIDLLLLETEDILTLSDPFKGDIWGNNGTNSAGFYPAQGSSSNK